MSPPKPQPAGPPSPAAAQKPSTQLSMPLPSSQLPPYVSPPPLSVIPEPPAGYKPGRLGRYRGYRPSSMELLAAKGAVVDLKAFKDYAAVFGSAAPEGPLVAQALALALEWRHARKPSENWEAYVREQDAIAWYSALKLLEELKHFFVPALAKNAALGLAYPALTAFLGASKETGKLVSATKKKRKKAKLEADNAATTEAQVAAVKAAAAAKPATPRLTVTV
jgi:hypothetical protein